MATRRSRPICFISYSWDDAAHKTWVRHLADSLDKAGVDVRFDQSDSFPGRDVTKYMETSIRESDFILLICTPKFAGKSNSVTGASGYEKRMIAADIKSGAVEGKYIPLLRRGSEKESIPSYLGSLVFLDFREDRKFASSFEELRMHIVKQPAKTQVDSRPTEVQHRAVENLLSLNRRRIQMRLYSKASLDPASLFQSHCERALKGKDVVVGWNVRPVPYLSAVHFGYLQQLSRMASFGFQVHITLYDLCTHEPLLPQERDQLNEQMERNIRKFQPLKDTPVTFLSDLLERFDGAKLFGELFQIARPSSIFGATDDDAATVLDSLIAMIAEQTVKYDMLLCGGSDASNYWLRLRSELSDKRIATNPLILEMPWLTGHSPEYVRLIPNEKDSLPQITDKMKKTKERNRSTLWHMLLGPCLTKPEPYPTSVAMLSKSIHETFRRSPFLK